MITKVRGRVWKFGDNINTDNMSPPQYIPLGIPEVARHCLEAVRPEFSREAKKGDIMLAGTNFGTGSSRETAPAAIKELGISLVIARSFSRIFFRNSVDIALPIMVNQEMYDSTHDGDIVSVDLTTGLMRNETKGEEFSSDPLPSTMMEIFRAGGLIEYALQEKW
jgi:3-isopropylmalate/(R)-2-methylmalate dehydratase small subunit